jgi:hypothetical protein
MPIGDLVPLNVISFPVDVKFLHSVSTASFPQALKENE